LRGTYLVCAAATEAKATKRMLLNCIAGVVWGFVVGGSDGVWIGGEVERWGRKKGRRGF
jgi:hypothetical protein